MWIQKIGCSTKFTIAVGLILTVAALMGMLSATGVRSIQQQLESDLQSKLDLVPLIAKLENSPDAAGNKSAEIAQIRSLAEMDIQTHGQVIDLSRGVHRVAFYGTIVVAAFGVGIHLLTRRLLFGRLRICFDAIHRIGEKDYSQRCELACFDEIGRIGAALNELMTSMEQQKREMEEATQREREMLQQQAEQERLAMVADREREAEETRRERERQEQQRQREREFAEQEAQRHQEEEVRATELREKINRLLESVCAVAEGDLRSKTMMKGTSLVDELAAGVGIMVKDLADLIREVAENADHFDGAARIFSENSQVLADGVVEQMDNIGEIRSSADELRKIVGDVMESAATAQEVTRRTDELAKLGGDASRKVPNSARKPVNRSSRSSTVSRNRYRRSPISPRPRARKPDLPTTWQTLFRKSPMSPIAQRPGARNWPPPVNSWGPRPVRSATSPNDSLYPTKTRWRSRKRARSSSPAGSSKNADGSRAVPWSTRWACARPIPTTGTLVRASPEPTAVDEFRANFPRNWPTAWSVTTTRPSITPVSGPGRNLAQKRL